MSLHGNYNNSSPLAWEASQEWRDNAIDSSSPLVCVQTLEKRRKPAPTLVALTMDVSENTNHYLLFKLQ